MYKQKIDKFQFSTGVGTDLGLRLTTKKVTVKATNKSFCGLGLGLLDHSKLKLISSGN